MLAIIIHVNVILHYDLLQFKDTQKKSLYGENDGWNCFHKCGQQGLFCKKYIVFFPPSLDEKCINCSWESFAILWKAIFYQQHSGS